MQASLLTKMLDSLNDIGIYVVERDTHRILYLNAYVRTLAESVDVGMICHEIWSTYCKNCPILSIENQTRSSTIHFNEFTQSYHNIVAQAIDWNGSSAYVIMMIPYRFISEDPYPWLQQAKEAYIKSISILLSECFIINLEEGYFVTCQVGAAGLELSDRQSYWEVGLSYFERIIHPADFTLFQESFSKDVLQSFQDGTENYQSVRVRRMSEYGEYRIVEYSANRIELFGMDGTWCVLSCKDIQDEVAREQRKNMEISQLAMAAKAVYQSLISLNLTQGTYEILANETKGVLVAASSGSLEELKALHLSSIHADYQETFQSMFSPEALVKSFEAGQDLIYMELRQKNPSGVYFWASTQVVRVPNHYTDDILAVAMCRSIETERQLQEEQRLRDEKAKALLEQALQKSQAASLAKNEFLSKVSHDIRTPLNAILGMTSLAKANMSATKDLFQTFDESLTKTSEIQELINDFEKLSGYLANIKISGEHLLGLVNEILDLSSMESGRIGLEDRTFDIEHLVSDVSALMQTRIIAKQQTLLVEVEPTIHTLVSGDQHKLRQVLFSILENASKYSSEHDKILFSVTDETAENAHSGLYRFIIQDEGIGMTQDFLEHIYEPFARADDTRINKVAGTGLGLTISKNIITMMGGDLHVESEYGKGSRFEIRLPLEKRAPIESDPPNIASSSNTDFSTMRILVAEDNDMNQEIMHEMIELIGANVVIVGDGALATQLISEHPADFFDLILMDIRMPGTNGYEATKQIRSLPIPGISNLPIIALTADAFRDDIKKAKQAGMNGHVAKPITLHKLKDIITQCQIWRTSGDVMTFYEDF